MEIPQQLKDKKFRFMRLTGKRPIDPGWEQSDYRYDSPEIISYNENVGFLCGVENIVVIDFDDENLQKELIDKLPQTYAVKSGGKGLLHIYLKTDRPVQSTKIMNSENKTLADIQSVGRQVVIEGSMHPVTGNKYTCATSWGIASIPFNDLKQILVKYVILKEKKESIELEKESVHSEEEAYLCCFHEETKPSLFVNKSKETFYCHGCMRGGHINELHDDFCNEHNIIKTAKPQICPTKKRRTTDEIFQEKQLNDFHRICLNHKYKVILDGTSEKTIYVLRKKGSEYEEELVQFKGKILGREKTTESHHESIDPIDSEYLAFQPGLYYFIRKEALKRGINLQKDKVELDFECYMNNIRRYRLYSISKSIDE